METVLPSQTCSESFQLDKDSTVRERRRVLMLAHEFPPQGGGGVYRTLRFVRYLGEFGWTPVVITTASPPNTNGEELLSDLPPETTVVRVRPWSVPKMLRRLRGAPNIGRAASTQGRERDVDGSQVTNGSTVGGETKRSLLKRLRRTVRCSLELSCCTPDEKIWWGVPAVTRGLRTIRKFRCDVIYSTGPPHSSHLIGAMLKRLTGLPLVLDFRDPWSEDPWMMGDVNPWGRRLLPWIERRALVAADRVVLNTARLHEAFMRRYPDLSDKFLTITNGYDPAILEDLGECVSKNSDSFGTSPARFCHTGGLYGPRDPSTLIAVIADLIAEGRELCFHQIGSGTHCSTAKKIADERGIASHVLIDGFMPHEEMLARARECDFGVIVQPNTQTQVPGKLFEMLALRKPILALTGDGATADIIRKYNVGVVAAPHDRALIRHAVVTLLERCQEFEESPGWTAALRDFNGRTLTESLSTILNEFIAKN